MSGNEKSGNDRRDDLAYSGVCPVCGEEFTDGFDDLKTGESIEGVRLCVVEKDWDGTGEALFHLPSDQNDRSVDMGKQRGESDE